LLPDGNILYLIIEPFCFKSLWFWYVDTHNTICLFSKKYLLVKKERPIEDVQKLDPSIEKMIDVTFVNIFETALTIQENYDLFKRAVGFDFDPLQVVFDLEDESSEFWNKIKGCEHSYLWGLLYGFGEKNTWGYFWKGRHIINAQTHAKEIGFADTISKQFRCKKMPSPTEKNAFSVSKFPLPPFASFSKRDPIVTQYEKEREGSDLKGWILMQGL